MQVVSTRKEVEYNLREFETFAEWEMVEEEGLRKISGAVLKIKCEWPLIWYIFSEKY